MFFNEFEFKAVYVICFCLFAYVGVFVGIREMEWIRETKRRTVNSVRQHYKNKGKSSSDVSHEETLDAGEEIDDGNESKFSQR